MEETTKQYPIDKFRALPEPVRDWLASTQITYLVSDLNRRLGYNEAEKMSIIPTLILRLAISTVSPESFISELSKLLDLSPSAAKALAQEIEEKMLRPIELILRNEVGIDIKLIHLPQETSSPSMAAPTTVTPAPVAAQPVLQEKLIATAEAAHPNEYRAPVPPASQVPAMPAPQVQSPVYAPSTSRPPVQSAAPQPAPSYAAPKPPMPKAEPLPPRQPMTPASGFTMPKVEPLPKPSAPVATAKPVAPQAPTQPSYVPKPTTMPGDVKNTTIPFRVAPSQVPKFPPRP